MRPRRAPKHKSTPPMCHSGSATIRPELPLPCSMQRSPGGSGTYTTSRELGLVSARSIHGFTALVWTPPHFGHPKVHIASGVTMAQRARLRSQLPLGVRTSPIPTPFGASFFSDRGPCPSSYKPRQMRRLSFLLHTCAPRKPSLAMRDDLHAVLERLLPRPSGLVTDCVVSRSSSFRRSANSS